MSETSQTTLNQLKTSLSAVKMQIPKVPKNLSEFNNDIDVLNSEDLKKLNKSISEKMDKNNPVGTGSFSMNRKADTTVGEYSHAEGYGTTASGESSHAEGSGTTASGARSHAEGSGTTASGLGSHAEGMGTTASGARSHAEGDSTKSSGDFSHAEGSGTTASGTRSHAEGSGTTASGIDSHAEGSGTTASGIDSHAEGRNTKTTETALYAHAEGHTTTASGESSHAEGSGTTASDESSHAEGSGTTASGLNSHAEGSGTTASGARSHAEGRNTIASGFSSHAEGYGTTASRRSQHAGGEFNKRDTESQDSSYRGKYIEIIGNGTNDSNRSNARTLDWEGNACYAGDVYTKSAAMDENAKKLATEEYVNTQTVQVVEQSLTDEQKAQARTNIGSFGYNWHDLTGSGFVYASNLNGYDGVLDWESGVALTNNESVLVLNGAISDINTLLTDAHTSTSGVPNKAQSAGRVSDRLNLLVDNGIISSSEFAFVLRNINNDIYDKWLFAKSFYVSSTNTWAFQNLRTNKFVMVKDGVITVDQTSSAPDIMLTEKGKAADAKVVGDKFTELENNKITTPITASVGQILAVKAVDENGKPSEWEVIDQISVPTIQYYIINDLAGITTDNEATTINQGENYVANLTATTGSLDNVLVYMGGINVTSLVYTSGVINIPSVNGNVYIKSTISDDVVGSISESNEILLSDTLGTGTYTLRYEDADGNALESFANIAIMEV